MRTRIRIRMILLYHIYIYIYILIRNITLIAQYNLRNFPKVKHEMVSIESQDFNKKGRTLACFLGKSR